MQFINIFYQKNKSQLNTDCMYLDDLDDDKSGIRLIVFSRN